MERGGQNAVRRLRKEIDNISKDKECLRHLYATDPGNDKTRIERTKGGLLRDSYRWILDSADSRQLRGDEQSQLLWIKGDPGKGKTMLLQAFDSRINNAKAVLCGQIYLLVDRQPSLILHVRKYDHVGKQLFEDANAWEALSEIFTHIPEDPNLQ
ncbi:hypothetical protein DL769_000136 [Monosporascus sp. CRB-8-3]|nr:hypothetical protein DL769_000136 [Monosporascus sp. CRB-8-3]